MLYFIELNVLGLYVYNEFWNIDLLKGCLILKFCEFNN